MRKLLLLPLSVVVVVGLGAGYWWLKPGQRTTFRTVLVERRPFLASITASGPLEPVDSIDVGAQVAGRIERFGLDPRYQTAVKFPLVCDALHGLISSQGLLLAGLVPVKTVDYGTPVERGTILAQIDDELYRNDVQLAQADVEKARAELQELENKQQQTEQDWLRAKTLFLQKAIAQAEHDAARITHIGTQDRINVAKAVLKRAEVTLAKEEKNLDYATIRSPVKGVIVDRRINVGQTVVASLTAPSLFLIATDLRRLQVWASVNEADIGQIWVGQKVLFTVDAYANEKPFEGHVAEDQPRLNASMTSNVVTYTVVVNVENSSLKLRPYMTANVRFVLSERSSALLVPNAAMRWRPQNQQTGAEGREVLKKLLQQRRASFQEPAENKERVVWIDDGSLVRPVTIKIGLSDGTSSEVLAGNLNEGDAVITGEESRAEGNGPNPFTPSMYGGVKKSQ